MDESNLAITHPIYMRTTNLVVLQAEKKAARNIRRSISSKTEEELIKIYFIKKSLPFPA
jgi:hypothetical protein